MRFGSMDTRRRCLPVLVCLLFLCGAGSRAAEQSFADAKAVFLMALKAGKVAEILDAVASVKRFETPEAALLFIDHGILHDDITVHQECYEFLTRLTTPACQRVVIDAAANEKTWERRSLCVRAMASYRGGVTQEKLEEYFAAEKQWQVRASAVRAMGHLREKRAIGFLIEQLATEKTGRVRWDIVKALRSLTGFDFEEDQKDWLAWWIRSRDTFAVPSAEEAQAKLDPEKQDLKTAVASGLYGTVASEKVAFVFDVSGSMSVGTDLVGTRMEIAKKELTRVVENLSPKSYFNVIAFASEIFPFNRRLVKADKAHVEKAVTFIAKLPCGGETNVNDALETAFRDPEVDTIYLLTDGTPTVGKETIPALILQQVAAWNRDRKVIINAIGFYPGDSKNEDKEQGRKFLLRLAHDNDGFYKEIY
ncbi:MAG: VWA domain-containing protein [Planctomycetes bacterium]|nr:VWA domain-containing protein [Planctomycetota bacterium]